MAEKDFDNRVHVGFLFDSTAREIKKAVNRGLIEEKGCNGVGRNGWLLGYLDRQTDKVFQKDLEAVFHFPKSTLADMLQALEKNGLIAKVPVDGDGRKKQIIVTEKGKENNETVESQIMAVEEYVTKGITQEQLQQVVSILEKMRANAIEYKSYIEDKKEE